MERVYKIFIVEDEIVAQKSLVRLLNQHFPQTVVVGSCDSVNGAIEWLKNPDNRADIIFMDVELSDGDCFEIFRNVEVKANVIMTTAYDSYALKAFEAGSVDYLLKPIDVEPLKRAMSRCMKESVNIDLSRILSTLDATNRKREYKERFVVKFNDMIVPIKRDEIAYIYSEDKINYLVTFVGKKYVIDSSLDIVIGELDPEQFFRISRSAIVSLHAIKSIIKQPGGRLRIISQPKSSFEMTVSRSRVADFLLWIEK